MQVVIFICIGPIICVGVLYFTFLKVGKLDFEIGETEFGLTENILKFKSKGIKVKVVR